MADDPETIKKRLQEKLSDVRDRAQQKRTDIREAADRSYGRLWATLDAMSSALEEYHPEGLSMKRGKEHMGDDYTFSVSYIMQSKNEHSTMDFFVHCKSGYITVIGLHQSAVDRFREEALPGSRPASDRVGAVTLEPAQLERLIEAVELTVTRFFIPDAADHTW